VPRVPMLMAQGRPAGLGLDLMLGLLFRQPPFSMAPAAQLLPLVRWPDLGQPISLDQRDRFRGTRIAARPGASLAAPGLG